ncbi:polysaccharide deacetylase family protein [Sporosarcina sp. USHLN248]|uniref:polysaccharide deacetylase family protein n=1 Tax=Sporosarcina sp. USHLN248 TaxID=3081300 RepID=UPI0030183828
MRKNSAIIFFLLVTIFCIGSTKASAEVKNSQRYVGLHDRVLPIEDIRVIDGDTKVPLAEIAKFLYLPVTVENGATVINKRGKQFVFDPKTGETIQDGKVLSWAPFIEEDGTIFISVKYISREIGFKIDYLKKQQTIRIYRDDYEHMSRELFEKMVIDLIEEKLTNQETSEKLEEPELNYEKAIVYLTFDDGPNQFTTINNETLKNYGVQATFFFLGKQMQANEKIVKTVAKDGHYIGTHSMTHDKNLVYKSTEAFIQEMNEGRDLIKQMTGNDAKLLRVPYGSVPHVTPEMEKELIKHGYKMWDWDVDSNDWRYTVEQANQIFNNVKRDVTRAYQSGDRHIVVLMHDRIQTTKALPEIIEWLQAEGYMLQSYNPDEHISQNFLRDTLL